MKKPDNPKNEQERLALLRSLNILDTSAEERFDRISRVASKIFDVPITLVSLVDENRQWFKSCVGLDASETPRDISFCGHAILGDDIFYIPNALEDERFADNPLVTGPPNIRFYAGVPLKYKEEAMGTFCLISDEPKTLSDEEQSLLKDMAGCIEAELDKKELLAASQKYRDTEAKLSKLIETIVDGIVVIDAHGIIQSVNPAARILFGYEEEELKNQNIKMLMPSPYAEEHDGYLQNYLETGEKKVIGIGREVTGLRSDGSTFPMELAVTEMVIGETKMFTGVVRDVSARHDYEKKLRHLEAIVLSSDDAIISKTLDGIIKSWNPGAEKMFGYTAEEALGRPMLMLFPEERVSEEDVILTKIRNGEKVNHFETVRKRRDGKLIDVSANVSPVKDEKGNVIGASKLPGTLLNGKKLKNSRASLFLQLVMN